MRLSSPAHNQQPAEGDNKKCLNSELWHACAGPLVSLPPVGSRVVYFPQGHSEQVSASTHSEVDAHFPNYPSLPPQLICHLHNVTMHADLETDEVYAQMTLQPLSAEEQKDVCLVPADLGTPSKQPTNYFCKTLTASDTSTHGGFSVPRRAAEKVFPPLDYSQAPPCQELIARDLHDNEWKFRHIFRGQPKRHLLTTGWSVFVSTKRLVAGDSVIFIWNEKNQLLLGIRRANRPQTVMPTSVLSSDTMHIGLLAAAAHAAATNSRFTIFFNPRASPSEFVVPLAKYVKAVYHTRVSVGMRFRMLFETEESSVRRYMGTITGISDIDPARWPNSNWRSVKVGWDESTTGERHQRVSLWEIEPLTTFPMYSSPFPLRLKRPWPSGLPSFHGLKEGDWSTNSPLMWLPGGAGDMGIHSFNFQGYGVNPWMQPRLDAYMPPPQPDMNQAMVAAALQEMRTFESSKVASQPPLQLQQSQNASNKAANLIQRQMLQESNVPNPFPQNLQESQASTQAQVLQQLQHRLHYNNQWQQEQQHQPLEQQLQHPQQVHQLSAQQQISPMPHLSPSQTPPLQPISSQCQHKAFSELVGNSGASSSVSAMHSATGSLEQDGGPHLLNLNPAISSAMLPRQVAVVHQHSAGGSYGVIDMVPVILPPMEPMATAHSNVSELATSLPPFPGREYSTSAATDLQNNLLYGVSTDSPSFMMQREMPNLINIGTENDPLRMPFATSSFANAMGSDVARNSEITASSCMDESGFLQSSENMEQMNPSSRTFVKVQKLGSIGRSLDISNFSSYNELRSELARLFGLEGQLEDTQRSGWQLVFVDRENDVLLLGDDPWQEFVNNVWYIKILSPAEVQQMGKEGLSVPSQKLSRSSSGNCSTRREY